MPDADEESHGAEWALSDEELAQLEAEREARYQRRVARVKADATLDPRIAAWFLDRTLWTNREASKELGVTSQRVTHMRGGRSSARRPRPHPSVFPHVDAIVRYVADKPQPAAEAGAIREWVYKRGTHLVDPKTGKMTKTGLRTGRARSARVSLSRAGRRAAPKQRRSDDE